MASHIYPERVEWVGRPPGSPLPHAIMVTLGVVSDDGFGGEQITLRGPMGEQEAAALGFSASKLVDGFNDAVAADLAKARAERDAIKADRDTLAAQIEALTAPAAPISVISDRQFFQALALAGDITEAEALAAVMTGTMPAKIEAAILELPAAQQFGARMLLSGATTFDRHHPMVALLGQILDRDAAALDVLWASAGTL